MLAIFAAHSKTPLPSFYPANCWYFSHYSSEHAASATLHTPRFLASSTWLRNAAICTSGDLLPSSYLSIVF